MKQMLLQMALCKLLSCFTVWVSIFLDLTVHLVLLSRKKEISPRDSKGENTRSHT